MKGYQSLSHTRWECKYHVVFIPKRRKKAIFGTLRRHLGEVFHELARHKEAQVVEGHLMPDHFTGEVFWARGYFVSTVGLDEEMVRAYIRHQENEDARFDQMKLGV